MSPLVQETMDRLLNLGLEDVALIRDRYEPQHFGNAEAVFRVGRLLVRFQRDRGQDFVDLASTAPPEKFYQFDDVDVAMGWKSLGEVLAKEAPEELVSVLGRLSQNLRHLEAALSGEQERFTRARLDKAVREREEALLARFKR